MTSATVAEPASRRPARLLLALAIVLVAASLRPPVTSLGPLLPDIEQAVGLSPVLAGLLTSAPTLVFGCVSVMVPWLVRHLSNGKAVTVSMAAVAVGVVVRSAGTVGPLLAGTLVAMGGIAVANVMLPAVVRAGFPAREGWMTGLYVSVMQAGATAGAAFAVPLATTHGGWQAGLAWWAVPAVVGLAVWLPSSRLISLQGRRDGGSSTLTWGRLARDRTAVAVMWFFGLQSALAYVTMGWLPTIMQEAGLEPAAAGSVLAVAITVTIPISLVAPVWLARRRDQRYFSLAVSSSWALGLVGLILAPTMAPMVWAAFLGGGLAGFPASLLLMGLRSATPADTTRVSAFAQGLGYLVALPAPLLFGLLTDVAGNQDVPLSLLVVLVLPLGIHAWRAGEPRLIGAAEPG